MIRFSFLLVISIIFSSQAIAAVKWNNAGGGSDKNLSTVNEGDGKKIPSWLMEALASVMHNGLEKKMVLHMSNAIDAKEFKFVNKNGRDALLIDLTYEDKGPKMDWRRHGTPGYAQRVQVKLSDLFAPKKGEESWYKLSYFLEGENLTPNEGNSNTAHYLSLFDLKTQSRPYNDTGVAFSYGTRQNDYSFWFLQNTKGEKVKYAGKTQIEFPANILDLAPATQKQNYNKRWVDIVLNIKWSKDGHTRLWIDNELILNAHSAPLGGEITKQYSFKFGPYRSQIPPNRRAPDIRVYYSGIGMEKTCEALLANCTALMTQVPEFQMFKHIKRSQVCFVGKCSALNAGFRNVTPLKLERFVGRRIWENHVLTLQQKQNAFSGEIETSTIIKDKSPVRVMTYQFNLPSNFKNGRIAFIKGVSNDGLQHSSGTPLSFALKNDIARRIEKNCGIKLIEVNRTRFPTFSIEEAHKISFTRFGYETELLSEKSQCQISLMDGFSDRFWFELLHLAGKSLRGSNENGNSGASDEKVSAFKDLQQKVKANIKR